MQVFCKYNQKISLKNSRLGTGFDEPVKIKMSELLKMYEYVKVIS